MVWNVCTNLKLNLISEDINTDHTKEMLSQF
jgi:hypothetical protein